MTRAEEHFRDMFLRGELIYDVDTGRIWKTTIRGRKLKKPRLANAKSWSGYLMLGSLDKTGAPVGARQHRVIWETFCGPIPEGMQINHKDLDKSNNRLSNLELVTPGENTRHAVAAGVQYGCCGEKHPKSKVSDLQIFEIYHRYKRGERRLYELAKDYGISRISLMSIFRGETRKYLYPKLKEIASGKT